MAAPTADRSKGRLQPRNTLSEQTPTINGRNGIHPESHLPRRTVAHRRGLLSQNNVDSRVLQDLILSERQTSPKRPRRETRRTSTMEDSPPILDDGSESEADVLAESAIPKKKRKRTDYHTAGDKDTNGAWKASQTNDHRTGVDALMDSREYATRPRQERLSQRLRGATSNATAQMTETYPKDIVSTKRIDLGMRNRQPAPPSLARGPFPTQDEGTRRRFRLKYFYARGAQEDIDRLVVHANGRKRWLYWEKLGEDSNKRTDLDDVIKATASLPGLGKKVRLLQRAGMSFWIDLEFNEPDDAFELFMTVLNSFPGFETDRKGEDWLENAKRKYESQATTHHQSLDADLAESSQRQRQSARQSVLQKSREPRSRISTKLEPNQLRDLRSSNKSFQAVQRDAPDGPTMHHTRRSTRSSGGVRMALDTADETPSRGLQTVDQLSPDGAAAVMAARHADFGIKWKKPLVYPKDGKKRATVEYEDLLRLDDGEFLNDNIIGFYLRYLMDVIERTHPSDAKRIYWFNSYFFEKLTDSPKIRGSINYDAVKRWTRDVDLFAYDYIVVPVNENAHWYLVLICNLPQLFRNEAEEYQKDAKPLGSSPRHPIGIEDSQEANRNSEANPIKPDSRTDDPMDSPYEASSRHLHPTETSDPIVEVPASPDMRGEPAVNAITATDSFEILEPKDLFSNTKLFSKPATQGHLNSHGGSKPAQRKKKRFSIRQFDPLTPAVITLDSLDIRHPGTTRAIKEYLVHEAEDKKGDAPFDVSSLQGMNAVGIPHQDNFCDCGPFLLAYMFKFTEDPTEFVNKLLQKDFEDSDWPLQLYPPQMRTHIKDLILSLAREQRSGTRKSKEAPLRLVSDPTKAEDNLTYGLRNAAEDEADMASVQQGPWKNVVKSSIEEGAAVHAPISNYEAASRAQESEVQLVHRIDSTVIPDSQEGTSHSPPLPEARKAGFSQRNLQDFMVADPASSPSAFLEQLQQAARVRHTNDHILLDDGSSEAQ